MAFPELGVSLACLAELAASPALRNGMASNVGLERAQLRSMPLSELRSMAQRLRARALGDSRDEFAEYADTSIYRAMG